ncbi:MAG: FAD assembly factor SdhE [Gammaproteobacteria bacterium]
MVQNSATSDDKKRLKWRCRRGLKELDVMLEKFLANGFDTISTEQQQHFSALLSEQDLDLLEWLTGKSEPVEPHYRALIESIQAASRPE